MRRIWRLSGSPQWAEIVKEQSGRLWEVVFYSDDLEFFRLGYLYLRECETALDLNGYTQLT